MYLLCGNVNYYVWMTVDDELEEASKLNVVSRLYVKLLCVGKHRHGSGAEI